MAHDPLVAALGVLSRFVVSEARMGDTLHRVSEITRDAIPAARTVGISMLQEGKELATPVYTDETSPRIDAAQYDSGRGPCIDSWRSQDVVYVADVTTATEYPEFAQAALDNGVRSTLSLPLVVSEEGVGALNLYAAEAEAFSDDDKELGGQLATTIAAVLANTEAYWRAQQLSENLAEAMKSRAVIEQAKGILMARSPELSADEAFELLRRASQRENVKLRDIAQRIVDRRLPPDPPGEVA